MSWLSRYFVVVCVVFGFAVWAGAEDAAPSGDQPASSEPASSGESTSSAPATDSGAAPAGESSVVEDVKKKAGEVLEQGKETVKKVGEEVEKSKTASDVRAGILQPIYMLAEYFSFSFFHWLAFAIMVAGVVSYALQLVLGKLVVLTKMGFSPAEIVSDSHALLVSLVGLVLTTQAAAENSAFTSSNVAVLSSTAIGAIVGAVLYYWGQKQELQAAEARGNK